MHQEKKLRRCLDITWVAEDIVQPNGATEPVETLEIGPFAEKILFAPGGSTTLM